MNEVTLADFRCFCETQTAQLAPLTLLVGENSTGKTSFLALVRVLWDVAFQDRFPDFKEPPYDLGSFDEIAHFRGGRGGRAPAFEAGFSIDQASKTSGRRRSRVDGLSRFQVTFRQGGSAPFPSVRLIEKGNVSAESRISSEGVVSLTVTTSKGKWTVNVRDLGVRGWGTSPAGWEGGQRELPPLGYLIRAFRRVAHMDNRSRLALVFDGVKPPDQQDIDEVRHLAMPDPWQFPRPFANAPMRSRPRRTYDPAHSIPDPEGEYLPMFLADVARRDQAAWISLRQSLERFGQMAGLFDEIAIRVLGGKAGGPFQVQVRKFGKRATGSSNKPAKGPPRNIIDVGYGVSQVLPVVTELLRPTESRMFLLQQPEVHLHPSAQAALGSLFCEIAADGRQLLVETHSDHLIDRVRMDIRDGKSKLKPDDVSILYFERRNLAVTINSLGWDTNGNLVAKRGRIPDGYRQFFRIETRRSLGL